MQDAIVIKPFVADQVKNAMIHGRVIFFSAPCGFGKTTTAWALLEGKKVYFAAAGEPGFRLPLLRETWDVLLLDQLQNLPEEEQELIFLRYVNEVPVTAICKITGMSRFAVYRKTTAILKRLREEMKEE